MKFIFILILLSSSTIGYSQRNTSMHSLLQQFDITLRVNQIFPLNCSNTASPSTCNLIKNGTFMPNVNPFDVMIPFNTTVSQVDDWHSSHGAPQIFYPDLTNIITGNIAPPIGVTSYGVLWAARTDNDPQGHLGSGVAQKIQPLATNKIYVLNFLERIAAHIPGNPANPNPNALNPIAQKLNITLLNCNDFNTIQSTNSVLPFLPNNSQSIYCETMAAAHLGWVRKTVVFTPNSNYDVIMIHPESIIMSANNPINYGFRYLITDIQLVENDFKIISSGNNCNKILSIECPLNGTTYMWTNTNTNTTQFGTSINIDASISSNIGVWSVSMVTTPPVVLSNGTCSTNGMPSQQLMFNINGCNNCINLPLVQ